eukprot:scpid35039/ scgid23251/ 
MTLPTGKSARLRRLRTRRRRDSHKFHALTFTGHRANVGVCFSGGGPRAAMFAAGAWKELLASNIRVDYLSTVSGGGYIASSYMDWIFRQSQGDRDSSWHEEYFAQLIPGLVSMFARLEQSTLLGAFDLFSCCLSIFWFTCVVCPLAILPVKSVLVATAMQMLRPTLESLLVDSGAGCAGKSIPASVVCASVCLSLAVIKRLLGAMLPTGLFRHLLSSLLGIAAVRYLLVCSVCWMYESMELSNLCLQSCNHLKESEDGDLLCTLTSWYVYLLLIGVLAAMVHLLFSEFAEERRANVLMVFLLLAASAIQGEYRRSPTGEVVQEADWSIGVTLLLFTIHPMLFAYQQGWAFQYYRNVIRGAFYHPDGCKGTPWLERFLPVGSHINTNPASSSSPQDMKGKELPMGQLGDIEPEWICQMTLNNWKFDEHDHDYKLITISPKLVDIISQSTSDKSKYLDMSPHSLSLSMVMTISAAFLSPSPGAFSNLIAYVREALIFLGVRFDANIPTWFTGFGIKNTFLQFLSPFVIQFALGSVLWIHLFAPSRLQEPAVSVFLELLWTGFVVIVTVPNSEGILFSDPLTEWIASFSTKFITSSPLALMFREVLCSAACGTYPDVTVNVSDGGHTENLGLLPLLKRRSKFIIVCDGSANVGIGNCSELERSLQLARQWLGCRFTSLEGMDLDADILQTLGSSSNGIAPQAFHFKVRYIGMRTGVVNGVHEGDILVLQPRHPAHRVEGVWSGPTDPSWTPERADELTGVFCRATDGKCPRLFQAFFGKYPLYAAMLLTPSPTLSEALFADGERAANAPAVQKFLEELPQKSLLKKASFEFIEPLLE